jgi:hypothetical protein
MGVAKQYSLVNLSIIINKSLPIISGHQIGQQQRVETDIRTTVEKIEETVGGNLVKNYMILI